MRLLIIGGSDAGISAALRAKELAPETRVTMVVADRFPNFSICGLPFFLSGEITDWRTLAHRTREEIEASGIELVLEHRATKIDPVQKRVTVVDGEGRETGLPYDKLVIGTGAVSVKPDIPGIDLPGVMLLRWMDDSFAFKRYLDERAPKSVAIVGAGYIGMEMADAMRLQGLDVTVVEYAPSVLTTVEPHLGEIVRAELERNGVAVATGVAVSEIRSDGDGLVLAGSEGFSTKADLVLAAVGGRPETALARSVGAETGIKGAVKVNRRMEISVPDIYVAGDCAETWHNLLQKYTYLPLGTTAHKQGRIAGENAVGGDAEFAGSLGTQSVKIFELVVARTGLRQDEAEREGFEALSVDFETWDHKVYYPGAKPVTLRITGDRKSGRLLGGQIIGHYGKEVSKRVDILAAAICNGMSVADLNHLDLSYTPPLSSPWDPVQMAAQAWEKALRAG